MLHQSFFQQAVVCWPGHHYCTAAHCRPWKEEAHSEEEALSEGYSLRLGLGADFQGRCRCNLAIPGSSLQGDPTKLAVPTGSCLGLSSLVMTIMGVVIVMIVAIVIIIMFIHSGNLPVATH